MLLKINNLWLYALELILLDSVDFFRYISSQLMESVFERFYSRTFISRKNFYIHEFVRYTLIIIVVIKSVGIL